jgi:o-succinylbenzoate---CoA ligase
VLASLRRSLAGDTVTAPLPPAGPERAQTLAMLRPEHPVTECGAAAVVATSGSTGQPRGVVLPASALVASAEATHQRLAGPGTWVLALPPHYVAGLMVIVRSLVAGRPVIEIGARLAELGEVDVGVGPAYLSLVPTQLTRALRDPILVRALGRFDAVLVGGAAADPTLLERARDAGVDVVTTYGMSETCGGCVYDGRPLDGMDVRIDDNGRISIGGPMVFAGYRLDPAATAKALVGGRLLTRDRGRRSADGGVTVLGRLDDVVISGGLNVDLATVEHAVRDWAGAEAAVVGVPDAEWGTAVVAVVESPEPVSLADLRDALRTLPPYALPRRLVSTPTLPRTAGGKIDRRRLVSELGDRPDEGG